MHTAFPTTINAFYHWEKAYPNEVFLRNRDVTSSGGYAEWQEYSWAEFGDQVRRCVAMLRRCLPQPGSRVGILSRNCPHWFVADLAIQIAGHVTVPLFTTMSASSVQYIVEFTDMELLFVGDCENLSAAKSVFPSNLRMVALPGTNYDEPEFLRWPDCVDSQPPVQGQFVPPVDELRSIIFTSGTTGKPKGAMYSLATFQAMASLIIQTHKGAEGSRFFSYLPLAHAGERLFVESVALLLRGVVTFNYSLETFGDDMREASPHVFFAVPRIWTKLQQGILGVTSQAELDRKLQDPDTADATRYEIRKSLGLQDAHYVISASAPLSEATHRWWEALGLPLCELYGQTELLPISLSHPASRKVGTLGQVPEGIEVRIAEDGEIVCRGLPMMLGYFRQPEKTAETIVDGWLHTGDKGYLDEDGYLCLTGRVKEIFKGAKGKYVAPGPIENLFNDHAFIEQQCLIGYGLPRNVMVAVLAAEGVRNAADAEIESELHDHVTRINGSLEPHERIGAVILSRKPWNIEDGTLTHTLKVKREVIESAYSTVVRDVAGDVKKDQVQVTWLDLAYSK